MPLARSLPCAAASATPAHLHVQRCSTRAAPKLVRHEARPTAWRAAGCHHGLSTTGCCVCVEVEEPSVREPPTNQPTNHATYNNPKLSSAAPSCSFGDAWRTGSAPAPPPAPLGSVVGCGGGDTRRLTRLESPSSWWLGGGESTSEPPPPAGIMSTVSLLAGVSGVAEPRVRTLVSINAPPSPEAGAAEPESE